MRRLLYVFLALLIVAVLGAACGGESGPGARPTVSTIDRIATEMAATAAVTIPASEPIMPELIQHDPPAISSDSSPFTDLFGCELDESETLYVGCLELLAATGCDELLPTPELWGAVEPRYPIAICRMYPDAAPRANQLDFINQARALAVDEESQALLADLELILATTGRFDRASAIALATLLPELDLSALQTAANTRYARLNAEFSAGLFIYRSGGLIPAFDRYLILDDGAPVVLHSPIEVQAAFAPIESAAEAFSYALVYTSLTTDFTSSLNPDLGYLGPILENSYVVESNGLYQVLLYEKTIYGCSRKPTTAVLVTVEPRGNVSQVTLPMGYYDPAEDFICVE